MEDLTPPAHTHRTHARRQPPAPLPPPSVPPEEEEKEEEKEKEGGRRKKEEEEEEDTPRPPLPRPRPPSLYTKRPRDWVKPKPSELGDCTTIRLRNIPNKLR